MRHCCFVLVLLHLSVAWLGWDEVLTCLATSLLVMMVVLLLLLASRAIGTVSGGVVCLHLWAATACV